VPRINSKENGFKSAFLHIHKNTGGYVVHIFIRRIVIVYPNTCPLNKHITL